MHIEEGQTLGVILVDQLCAVAAATGPRSGTDDNRWYGANRSLRALERISRCREDPRQRLGLAGHIVGAGNVAGFTVGDAMLRERQL